LYHTFQKVTLRTGLFEDNYGTITDDVVPDDDHPDPSSSPQQSLPSATVTDNGGSQPEEMPSTSDVTVCEEFYQRTCGCDKDRGNPCSKQFPVEHFIERRAQCSFLTKDELDLVLMGFISSAMLDSDVVKDGRHVNPAKRRRLTMAYKHHGKEVCRKTFLFLHDIGKDRLQNVKEHYKVEGLQVRINKNTKCSPHHAMPLTATKYAVTFLNNYAEVNAILLPGRIPTYKRDDIKLLPSSRSKAVRHLKHYCKNSIYLHNTENLGVLR